MKKLGEVAKVGNLTKDFELRLGLKGAGPVVFLTGWRSGHSLGLAS